MRKFELVLFFDFIDAVPNIRKLSCSFQQKGNSFLKIPSNLDMGIIEVYIARNHSPQRALIWNACVVVPVFKLTGNLNYFILFPKSWVDRGKNMYYKASDLCHVNMTKVRGFIPHKEHTESAKLGYKKNGPPENPSHMEPMHFARIQRLGDISLSL